MQEFQVREPNIRVEDIIDVIEGKNIVYLPCVYIVSELFIPGPYFFIGSARLMLELILVLPMS